MFSRNWKKIITAFILTASIGLVAVSVVPSDAFAMNTIQYGGPGGANSQGSARTGEPTDSEGWFSSLSSLLGFDALAKSLAKTVLEVMSWFLWVAGVAMNLAIKYTIVDMADKIKSTTGIDIAWTAIRDLANMSFIFVLLYTAIGTVLGLSGVNWQNAIKNIIIAALLINFSMFLTKVAIDASNIVTIGIYDAILSSTGASINQPTTTGISNVYTRALGVTTLYNGQTSGLLAAAGDATHVIVLIAVLGSILMLVAGFVFLAAAWMFLIRYVILILLIIFSPIAFITSVLPPLRPYASQWRTALTGQLIFAPVFMMLNWVALRILTDPSFSNPAGTGGSRFGANIPEAMAGQSFAALAARGSSPDNVGLILNFGIVMIFLVASLVISKSMAKQGAGALGGVMDKGSAWAGAAMFGGAAYLGRRSVGAASTSAAERFKERAATSKTWYGKLYNTQMHKMADRGSKASFDMRGMPVVGGALGAAGAGAAAAGGYAAMKKQSKDKADAWQKDLTSTRKKMDAKNVVDEGAEAVTNLDSFNKSVGTRALTVDEQAQKDELERKIEAMRKQVNTMSDSELVDLGKDKIEKIAKHVDSGKFMKILKNDKWSEAQKTKFKGIRYGEAYQATDDLEAHIKTYASTGPTTAQLARQAELEKKAGEMIGRIGGQELEVIDRSYLTKEHFASHLDKKAADSLTKPDSFLAGSQRQQFTDARVAPIKRKLKKGTPYYNVRDARITLQNVSKDAKTLAALDADMLANEDVIDELDKSKLSKLAAEMTDPVKRADVRTKLKDIYADRLTRPGYTATKKDKELHTWLDSGPGATLFS